MARRRDEPSQEFARWHLDRRVPIMLIVTLFLTSLAQIIVGTYWVSNVTRDIEFLKENAAKAAKSITDLTDLKTEVATLRSDMRHFAAGQDRLQTSVDRLLETAPRRTTVFRPRPAPAVK